MANAEAPEYKTPPATAVKDAAVPPYAKPTAVPCQTELVECVLFVKVCVPARVATIAPPPAVEPSCSLSVFASVSTVSSAIAPVNALFWVVVPRLNCTWVAI